MDQKHQEISVNTFLVAEHVVRIVFNGTRRNNMSLLSSFEPFRIDGQEEHVFFQLTVDDTLLPVRENRERIGKFATGNGDTVVERLADGGYKYIIKDYGQRMLSGKDE